MNIEIIINEYGSYIYNYALKLTCHPIAAEDLSQETFINAWKHINTLKDEYAIKAWLRKICFNLFLNKERKNQNKLENLYDEIEKDASLYTCSLPTPEDEIIVDESIRELQNGCFLAMVRKLTLNQRITFSLIDMFGLSIDDVSNILGISIGAVKGLLYRSRMKIDSFFAHHCSILDTNNPCSCKAWIEFSKKRSNMQDAAEKKKHKFVKQLDYKNVNYVFNDSVRRKINFLYKNMPQKKPSDLWYRNVTELISEMYYQN